MELEKLLSQKGLIEQSPKVKDILDRANSKDKPVKLFYGETYDEEGNTIDSMKYYFFISMLSKALKEKGIETDPTILIADVAACRNVSQSLNERYLELGEKRAKFVRDVKDTYGLDLNVIKMSDYLFDKEFQKKLQDIRNVCKDSSSLMEKIKKTVPESKLDIERIKGYAYSYDEIGTIIDLDVKVGPPREDLYDDVARDIAHMQGTSGLMSLFLTPTFPVGKNWAYFFSREGIEKHGITAYKAGSKRLQNNRIRIGRTSKDEARKLIQESFISKNPSLPNPCLDLAIISSLAKTHCDQENNPIAFYDDFYLGKLSTDELKNKTSQLLNKYILEKFEK